MLCPEPAVSGSILRDALLYPQSESERQISECRSGRRAPAPNRPLDAPGASVSTRLSRSRPRLETLIAAWREVADRAAALLPMEPRDGCSGRRRTRPLPDTHSHAPARLGRPDLREREDAPVFARSLQAWEGALVECDRERASIGVIAKPRNQSRFRSGPPRVALPEPDHRSRCAQRDRSKTSGMARDSDDRAIWLRGTTIADPGPVLEPPDPAALGWAWPVSPRRTRRRPSGRPVSARIT